MKTRCPWLNPANEEYVRYHDREWGRPERSDDKLFEILTLEGAQAGLSWETILRKRAHYRQVFLDFDPHSVAKMSPCDIKKIMQDPGIIRNKLKVESTITNAQAIIKTQEEFGRFADYLWQWVDHRPLINNSKSATDFPSYSNLSKQITRDLKKRGFKFVGPTTVYSFLQAAGLVQDHAPGCYLHGKALKNLRSL